MTDDAKTLAAVKRRLIETDVIAAARKHGVRDDALDVVRSRAEALFSLNMGGNLRGKDGLTADGWLGFVLRQEASHLYELQAAPTPDKAKATPYPETPRQRLARANGEPSAEEVFK